VPSSPDWRPLELPVVGELVGKLMDKQAMERTLRKSFAHGERVTAELVEENWAPLSRRENRTGHVAAAAPLRLSADRATARRTARPTLILWGDADRLDRPWQARELGRCISDATVRILPGCGRSVQEDCPVPADHALSSFLTGRSCP
jgi:pimeloyl-ACP methyl ester carboxylesterase